MKAKYEEKFIVINRKHLSLLPRDLEIEFVQKLTKANEFLPNHKYYTCNQDELYAQDVIDIILEGEHKKMIKKANDECKRSENRYKR